MATSTFERKIELSDPDSLRRLMEIMTSEAPKKPLSEHPFSETDRDRSEKLLKQFFSRSQH